MAIQEWLFRGVSRAMHDANEGLQPKVTGPFSNEFKWGEPGLKWGAGGTWGRSERNAILRHQLDQKGFPTSGVSVTPFRDRAEFYALAGGTRTEGIVYRIKCELLHRFSIRVFRVSEFVHEPSVPADDEFILVGVDGRAIPAEVVGEVISVGSA